MSVEWASGVRPDLYQQLAVTNPFAGRARRLFERGRVVAVSGNEADVLVGYDARNNALELKGVPIASGYVPGVGDWVAIGYEAGNSGAPWVTGPSMPAEASEDPPGIGVFSVCGEEPAEAAASTVYFDEGRAVWRGFDGVQWVDFCDSVHPSAHNSLPDLQGGAAGQYYHLTAAEYAGTWAHRLLASDDDEIPIQGYRTTSYTNEYASALLAEHKTSGDMADGFAAGILFALEDATSGGQSVGRFAAVRAGADDTADFVWWPAAAGVFNERMRLTAAGVLKLPAMTATRVVYVGSGGALSGDANLTWSGSLLTVLGLANRFVAKSNDGTNDAAHSGMRSVADVDSRYSEILGYRGADSQQMGWQFNTWNSGAVTAWRMNHVGQLLAVAGGSAALPAFSFWDSPTTGFYRYGADVIGIAIAGGALGWLRSYAGGGDLSLFDPTDGSQARLFADGMAGGQPMLRLMYKDGSYAMLDVLDVTGTGSQLYMKMGGAWSYGWNASYFYPYSDGLAVLGKPNVGWLSLNLQDAAHSPAAEGEVRADSAAHALEHYIGGAVHYNGAGLYAGPTTTETATGSGTKAETALTTKWTVPGALWAAGKVIRVRAYVYATVSGVGLNGTITLKLYVGGTGGIMLTLGGWIYNTAQNHNSVMEADILVNTRGSSGAVTCLGWTKGWSAAGSIDSQVTGSVSGMMRDSSTKTLNTTAGQDIVVTYGVDGSSPGSWTVALKELVVETIR